MISRRNFIQKTGTTAAGLGLASAMPFVANASKVSANDKIVVGLIGAKGMGYANLKAFLKEPGIECAAICDVDANVLNERAANVEEITGKKPKLYGDFRQLIDRNDIDVVIIGTPDHWHCLPMVYACETGKDVYCEKPLANSIEEINIMLKAARKYKRVVQVGQWQRSDPHWQDAVAFVHSGKLGKIRTVRTWSYQGWMNSVPVKPDGPTPEGVDYDMWLGPAPKKPFNPNRFHFTFRWFWDYAGGMMTDWGVHILDYGLFGMKAKDPKSVMSMGGKFAYPKDACETPDTQQAIYEFDGYTLLWDHGIGINGGYYGRTHGVGFVGNNGTLVVDRGGWEVIPEYKNKQPQMEAVELQKSQGKGLELHVKNFIECIKTREKPNADIEIGAHIAKVAHLGNIAFKTGRRVYWNSEKNEFINDKEATELTKANYRAPWKLPVV